MIVKRNCKTLNVCQNWQIRQNPLRSDISQRESLSFDEFLQNLISPNELTSNILHSNKVLLPEWITA